MSEGPGHYAEFTRDPHAIVIVPASAVFEVVADIKTFPFLMKMVFQLITEIFTCEIAVLRC